MPADFVQSPAILHAIGAATQAAGFSMASDPETGALLRALAASKPGGSLLEMGTGTGMGTAWLLDGMDAAARLTTVDSSEQNQAIARRFHGADPRLTFYLGDGGQFLDDKAAQGAAYDLIFADTWPGKFHKLDVTLGLLRPGGLYVVDDLLPLPNWTEEHAASVDEFLAYLTAQPGLRVARIHWASGLLIATRAA